MKHHWKTLPTGQVEVDGTIIQLDMRSHVLRWLPSVTRHCAAHGVPVHWALGFIKAESNGDPKVVSPDHGYGLMQITSPSLFRGIPPTATLADPDINISIGVQLMGSLRRRVGFDLPKLASGYNAGLPASNIPYPSTRSPWGMRETTGHIERAVRASNTAFALLEETMPTPNERFAATSQSVLSRGAMSHRDRGDELEALLDAAFGRGSQLRTVYSSCAYGLAALMHKAGLTPRRPWPPAKAITTWLGVSHFAPPDFIELEDLTIRRGDVLYWCSDHPKGWKASANGHVGGTIAGAGWLWQTVEGGGGADGTLLRLSDGTKDIRFSHNRPLRGAFRPNTMRIITKHLATSDTDPMVPVTHPTLRKESKLYDAVKDAQSLLGELKVDGWFGPKTELRAMKFQDEHGLVADGIIGPRTWAELEKVRP